MTVMFTFTYDPEISLNTTASDESFHNWVNQLSSESQLEEVLEGSEHMLKTPPSDHASAAEKNTYQQAPVHLAAVKERLRSLRRG